MTRLDAFARVKLAPGARLPEYKTEGASGMDLCAFISEDLVLKPFTVNRVRTGITIAIPEGFEGQIRPRSGLATRGIFGILGTIDSDYRGEVMVLLSNESDTQALINPGDRIAQLVIAPVVRCRLQVVDELDDTARGSGGFGSTGVR